MIYVGIDPGISGGMVGIYRPSQVAFVCPDVASEKWSPHAACWLNALAKMPHFIAMEAIPRGGPNRGTNSALTMGINYGCLLGHMNALGLNFTLATPLAWQVAMLGRREEREHPDPKAASVASCEDGANIDLVRWFENRKNPHDGLADAYNLACYAFSLTVE